MSLILQSLGTAIAATKVLSAQQVVRNEAGKEVNDFEVNIFKIYWLKTRCKHRFTQNRLFRLLSQRCAQVYIPLSSSGVQVQQNSVLPDYLPEDEESPQREVDRAISRTAAKEDTSGSWLNTAASFLTKTFYWWSWSAVRHRLSETGSGLGVMSKETTWELGHVFWN